MVQRIQLANGVRLVVEPMEHIHSVAIGIWVHTGSRTEQPSENGISHFVEHLMFKGTESMSAAHIAAAFDRIGGHVNAFTSKEYTCFMQKLSRHAKEAARILSDMFFHSSFKDEEIERERQVILEEIRMVEDTADDVVHDDLDRAAFGATPLGLPILGSEQSIQSFDRNQLRQFVKDQYRPERVVVSVAGNMDSSLLDQICDDFSQFEESDAKQDAPIQQEMGFEHLVRKKPVEQAHLCLGLPGVSLTDERLYAMVIYNHLLGGGMSSRLFQEIREQRALAYSVYSYHTSYQDTGMLTIYAGTATERLEETYATTMRMIEELAKSHSITEEDLESAKAHVIGSTLLGLESSSSRMNRNGRNEVALQEHQTLEELSHRIERVHLPDVHEIAEHIHADRHAMALISPDGKLPYN
ncbi:LOW QUALITY PROTEIN: peptidase [Geomicrobium sp. JCM 19037]|nr:LOW QUALITY PROTEIN: peptidase [Geomicrobium sp. JCM 19037]